MIEQSVECQRTECETPPRVLPAELARRTGLPYTSLLPSYSGRMEELPELWRHRELFRALVWRIIAVRYRVTFIGTAWALLQPFSLMVVFTVFLGLLARMPSDGIPYPIFFYSGVLAWQLVAQAVLQGTATVVANDHLVKRLYFPRSLLPAAAVTASLFDFLVALPGLFLLMAVYGMIPSAGIFAFPLAILLATSLALGLALWGAALNVFYRDISYVVPFLVQIWMFASPVIYPESLVPEKLHWLYASNPMVTIIGITRWAFAGGPTVPMFSMAISGAVSFVILVLGYRFFRRREASFSDVI